MGKEAVQSRSFVLVNKCLQGIGKLPMTKRKLQSKKYAEKIGVITDMMGSLMISDDDRTSSPRMYTTASSKTFENSCN